MNSIIIVLLLIIMVCAIRVKLLECPKSPIIIPNVIKESFEDIEGVKIKGSGLTPTTTPARRSCAQLMVSNSQETSLLRPGDI
jgi:hypothetical protein